MSPPFDFRCGTSTSIPSWLLRESVNAIQFQREAKSIPSAATAAHQQQPIATSVAITVRNQRRNLEQQHLLHPRRHRRERISKRNENENEDIKRQRQRATTILYVLYLTQHSYKLSTVRNQYLPRGTWVHTRSFQ